MSSTFRIFLASSSELAAERAALEIRVNRINKAWQPDDIFLHLEIWEDFIDTVSRTRKQDDYNAAIRKSKLFVILVHHRLGKYWAEEFKVAHDAFLDNGQPQILVYLKNPPRPRDPDPSPDYDSVRVFRRRLAEIDHFPDPYQGVAELQDHFTLQLEKLRSSGFFQRAQSAAPEPDFAPGATLHGSGALAVGKRAQAASGRGVNIGGNQHGEVRTGDTRIDTGGGGYFAGPVTVQNGNLVGRDHQETHTQIQGGAAPGASDLAEAVDAMRQLISQHTSSADHPPAAEVLEELAVEAAKPEPQRSDGRMARLLDGLVDLIPSGAKAIAATLLSPMLAGLAGPLTEAVLSKLGGKRAP